MKYSLSIRLCEEMLILSEWGRVILICGTRAESREEAFGQKVFDGSDFRGAAEAFGEYYAGETVVEKEISVEYQWT